MSRTRVTVGRSREELLAAAAALTAVMHEVDDDALASKLALRAQQFESESWDAPPISAAGELTDDRVLDVVQFGIYAGVARFLVTSTVTPEALALAAADSLRSRMVADPALRLELLEGARHLLGSGCTKNHWGGA